MKSKTMDEKTFKVWAAGCAHVNADKKMGRDSLGEAIIDFFKCSFTMFCWRFYGNWWTVWSDSNVNFWSYWLFNEYVWFFSCNIYNNFFSGQKV